MPRNWARVGKAWLPIKKYGVPKAGPVLFSDSSQTIQWIADKPGQSSEVEHEGKKIKAAYWSPAEYV